MLITTLALLGSVGGAWLVARHDVRGYYAWFVANFLWLFDSIGRSDVPQILLWSYYILTCIVGVRSWGKR